MGSRISVVGLALLAASVAGCGSAATSVTAQPSASDSSSATEASAPATSEPTADVLDVGCARMQPDFVGPLTGAWQGDDDGVYYIRQVGRCIWWFGTSLTEIEPGVTEQPGFANVAAGRLDGDEIELEWADVPVGDILGGGGLTLSVDESGDVLTITANHGNWGFGATVLRRMEGEEPSATGSASATAPESPSPSP